MIQLKTVETINSDGFLGATMDTATDIFSMFLINIDNELDLFKAAERYAKANGNRVAIKEVRYLFLL